MRPGFLAATAAMLLSLTLTAPSTAHAEDTAPADRKPVTDFSLPTLEGKKVKLSDAKGKVVVISFWATWCGPCKQELPLLDAIAKKYADKGLVVLSINTDAPKTVAEVRRVVKSKELTLPILLDGEGAVASKLDPANAMPYTLYLDRQGRVAHTHEGFQPGDEKDIEARIVALLAETPSAPAQP
jgi:thiol-disulfide isomerase/thioredoxin